MSNMPPPYPGQEPYQGQGQQYPPANPEPYGQPYPSANPTPYGPPAAPQSPYGGGFRPQHPQATVTLVLGIVSIFVALMCCLPVGIAPWIMGSRGIKQVDANPGMYDGRGQLVGGMVTGIVGTVVSVIAIIATIAYVAWAVNSPEFQEEWDSALAPKYSTVSTYSS